MSGNLAFFIMLRGRRHAGAEDQAILPRQRSISASSLSGRSIIASLAALGLGSFGFAAEILVTAYGWWRQRTA